jgi:hypothetical protein
VNHARFAERRVAPSLRSGRLVRIDIPSIVNNIYARRSRTRVPPLQSFRAVSRRGAYSGLLYKEQSRFWSRLEFWRTTGLRITTKGASISASDRGFLNLLKCSYRCKVTTDIPSPKTAKSRLARFSAASITNTGGKGSLREGRIAQMTAAPALH